MHRDRVGLAYDDEYFNTFCYLVLVQEYYTSCEQEVWVTLSDFEFPTHRQSKGQWIIMQVIKYVQNL